MLNSSMRLSPIPNDTAHATRTVFNLTNAYLIIGDQIDHWLRDIAVVDRSPAPDRSVVTCIRLAAITIFQYAEDLPDRLAADAVRTRMDWKYALHLPLNGPSFDYTALREYRQRSTRNPIDHQLLQRLIEQVAAIGLLPLTERQDIVAKDVLVAVDNLSRIEDLFEALQATLVALAACQPDWLLSIALPHWYERYTRLPVHPRLPHDRSGQASLAQTIGEDAAQLLAAIDRAQLTDVSSLAEIRQLRHIWHQQFTIDRGLVHWRALWHDAAIT